MRHIKHLIVLSALLFCCCLAASALAEGPLTGLWDSGTVLLFHTDNVTVDGEASFDLDGVHFKTALLHYVQDGADSYYGLKLLTPRKDGTERETGWTIIARENPELETAFVYVMEAYTPGEYRQGTDAPQNSLLRRSLQLDALTYLGGQLVRQVEPTLPEGAVTVTEESGAKTVRVSVTGDQLTDVVQSALSIGATYLADRWFSFEHDRCIYYLGSLDSYVAPATALADGTARWELRQADVDFTLDAEGRLTAVKGTAQVDSIFWDGEIYHVQVQFDLRVTAYGESQVIPFSPDDYQVTLHQND